MVGITESKIKNSNFKFLQCFKCYVSADEILIGDYAVLKGLRAFHNFFF